MSYLFSMIIDGRKIAEEMLAEAAEEVKKLPKKPRLAAILVSDKRFEVEPRNIEVQPRPEKEPEAQPREPFEVEPLMKFLELKKKAAEKVGIDFRFYEFPAEITTQKLRKEIVRISKAVVNDGVIIELPLPKRLNVQYLLNAIPPEKDVDVLSEKAQGAFFVGRSSVLPPAVEAVKQIFEKHNITRPVRDRSPRGGRSHAFGGAVSNELNGKNCAVFGYGLLVGRQVSHWLASQGATVSIINELTPNPERLSLDADIIVSGVGPARDKNTLRTIAVSDGASKPYLITVDMVKEGAVVIDFGISYLPKAEGGTKPASEADRSPEHFVKQNVLGDVDFENISKKAGLITPVPGGVGPIVVAAVLSNLATLVSIRNK